MEVNFISNDLLLEISCCAKSKPNQEICGIITCIDSVKKFIEYENIAQDKQKFFALNPEVFIDYNVDIVVHSHCLGSCQPSALDKKCSKYLDVPFLIYSTIDDNFCLYDNKSVTTFKV